MIQFQAAAQSEKALMSNIVVAWVDHGETTCFGTRITRTKFILEDHGAISRLADVGVYAKAEWTCFCHPKSMVHL